MSDLRFFLVVALVILLLVALLTVELSNEATDHDSMQVKTVQQWGRTAPPYVLESSMFTTTTTARARTAPIQRKPVHVAAATRPVVGGHDEAIAAIRQAFARFGEQVVQQAVNVSGCETGGTYNPAVVNSSGHTGLFQLSPRYHTARAARLGFTWDRMREALPNALVAADLFGESRWGPWTCRYAA